MFSEWPVSAALEAIADCDKSADEMMRTPNVWFSIPIINVFGLIVVIFLFISLQEDR